MSRPYRRLAKRNALFATVALAFATQADAATFTWLTGEYSTAGLPNPLNGADLINALSGGNKSFAGSITIDGRLNWQTTNSLFFEGAGTTLRNNGTIDFQADTRIRAIGTNDVLDNAGVLTKSGGAGVLSVESFITNRSGARLDASSGTVSYVSSGIFEAGSIFSGAGRHVFESAGTFTFNDNFTGADNNLRFNRGSFVSGGTQRMDPRTNLTWGGGTFLGDWSNSGGHTITALAGQVKSINGSFVNDGRVNWATTDSLFTEGAGTTLRNNGIIDFQADARIRAVGTNGAVDNAGLLRKSAGTGATSIESALTNTGIIETLSGTIVLPNNWQNDGTLRGIAAFQTNVLRNAGNIAPGLPDPANRIATLRLNGALIQTATGFLDLDVGLGGLSDLLDVSGAVTFAGALHVNRVGSYVAQLGDTFRVANYASYSGRVLDIQEFGFADGVQFDAVYSADHMDIVVSSLPVPEPATYALMAGGLVLVWRAKRRRGVDRA